MTLSDFLASLSRNISSHTGETICHDRPYLSFNQPHCPFSPPWESSSHISSISFCVSHLTISEMASENVKCGPPFKATNSCPSISNVTVMTDPFGLPATEAPASTYRV